MMELQKGLFEICYSIYMYSGLDACEVERDSLGPHTPVYVSICSTHTCLHSSIHVLLICPSIVCFPHCFRSFNGVNLCSERVRQQVAWCSHDSFHLCLLHCLQFKLTFLARWVKWLFGSKNRHAPQQPINQRSATASADEDSESLHERLLDEGVKEAVADPWEEAKNKLQLSNGNVKVWHLWAGTGAVLGGGCWWLAVGIQFTQLTSCCSDLSTGSAAPLRTALDVWVHLKCLCVLLMVCSQALVESEMDQVYGQVEAVHVVYNTKQLDATATKYMQLKQEFEDILDMYQSHVQSGKPIKKMKKVG